MTLSTRLTRRLGIRHPILLAPMGSASGGRLAAAVSAAGGLGLIGGGYGDAGWIDEQFQAAGNQRVGCGFITWSLANRPQLLAPVLARRPAALMLSFGDPRPFAPAIKQAGVALICQVQTLAHAREALEAGADIIIAQGAEAGGHGASRGLFPLLPAVVDLVAARRSEAIVVAAGGIADGRGLAAALMLGAEGVLVGTRFYVSDESLAHPNAKRAAAEASGDDTLRTTVIDLVRDIDWPAGFTARMIANTLTARWHGNEAGLAAAKATEIARYEERRLAGDFSVAGVLAGEGIDLMHDVPAAGVIVERLVAEAEQLLRLRPSAVGAI
ncbi:MAG: nitronate monooxygenase [Proteobacteria bacterium]|nr:nitronate monooxygenase [Pseudomonadota bacterium]